jgi:hypothetical protein
MFLSCAFAILGILVLLRAFRGRYQPWYRALCLFVGVTCLAVCAKGLL